MDGSNAYKLSVIVAAYNEQLTVGEVVHDLLAQVMPCELEVIVVDDGSHDRTPAILAGIRDPRLKVIRHPTNMGKGAALATGLLAATGTHMVPFDADSEYDPRDLPRLMEPVVSGRSDVVYGARIPGMNTLFSSAWYPIGSWVTTWIANLIFHARVKDLHTCLKVAPMQVIGELPFRQRGFGFDTELTARLLKMGLRPYEIPVSYHGRSREEGKKIKISDGVQCLVVLMRIRFSRGAASRPPEHYSRPQRRTTIRLVHDSRVIPEPRAAARP